jgi:hypothetical protein
MPQVIFAPEDKLRGVHNDGDEPRDYALSFFYSGVLTLMQTNYRSYGAKQLLVGRHYWIHGCLWLQP